MKTTIQTFDSDLDKWSKPREDWMPFEASQHLPYPCRSFADLVSIQKSMLQQIRDLRKERDSWQENSNAWQNSALLMCGAVLAIGEALGVSVDDSEILKEANYCAEHSHE